MRAAIRQEIESINPLDDLERAHQSEALAWVDSGASLFRIARPDVPPKHLVSYFVLVDGEHILLVDHLRAQLWLPTGGHVEPDEHPRAAVLRELREELEIVPESDIAHPKFITCTTTVGLTAGHTDVSLWYVIAYPRHKSLKHDTTEFADLRWFHFSEVPASRVDPHLGRFMLKLST